MTHIGQKIAFGLIGQLRRLFRVALSFFGEFAIRDVARDAKCADHFAAVVAQRGLGHGDPTSPSVRPNQFLFLTNQRAAAPHHLQLILARRPFGIGTREKIRVRLANGIRGVIQAYQLRRARATHANELAFGVLKHNVIRRVRHEGIK